MVTLKYKRLFIRGLKYDADATTPATALSAILKTIAQARLTETEKGLALVSASANGVSSSFLLPQGSITPEACADLVSEMLDSYDRVRAALIAAGNATPTDDQIYTGMLAEYPAETNAPTHYKRCYSDLTGVLS